MITRDGKRRKKKREREKKNVYEYIETSRDREPHGGMLKEEEEEKTDRAGKDEP